MNFWKNFKKLFAQEVVHKENQDSTLASLQQKEILLEHKVIERSKQEQIYFNQWKTSNVKSQMLEWIASEYKHYQQDCASNPSISFMSIPSINGFVIHFCEHTWRAEDFSCLFDYFKLALKKERYWSQMSETKTVQKTADIETIERHYLKPPREFGLPYGEKMNQKFGNIMISLKFINKKIVNLKLCATHYNDRLYSAPLQFEYLIHCLCND